MGQLDLGLLTRDFGLRTDIAFFASWREQGIWTRDLRPETLDYFLKEV